MMGLFGIQGPLPAIALAAPHPRGAKYLRYFLGAPEAFWMPAVLGAFEKLELPGSAGMPDGRFP